MTEHIPCVYLGSSYDDNDHLCLRFIDMGYGELRYARSMFAFLCAMHPRAGKNSPASVITQYVASHISYFVVTRPTTFVVTQRPRNAQYDYFPVFPGLRTRYIRMAHEIQHHVPTCLRGKEHTDNLGTCYTACVRRVTLKTGDLGSYFHDTLLLLLRAASESAGQCIEPLVGLIHAVYAHKSDGGYGGEPGFNPTKSGNFPSLIRVIGEFLHDKVGARNLVDAVATDCHEGAFGDNVRRIRASVSTLMEPWIDKNLLRNCERLDSITQQLRDTRKRRNDTPESLERKKQKGNDQ